MKTRELAPSKIRYLHDSISACFRNKEYILDTFEKLLYERLVPDDIPKISVFKWGDTWRIYDGHRRLYLYKSLEKQDVIKRVTVKVVPKKKVNWEKVKRKNTSKNGGKTVEIRNDDKFNGIKGQIVEEYKVWLNANSETEGKSEDSDYEYESDSRSDESYYQYSDDDGDSDIDDLADQFGNWRMY